MFWVNQNWQGKQNGSYYNIIMYSELMHSESGSLFIFLNMFDD